MLTSMLLEASGAGSFFSGGGNYFDEYPYLDLTEATAALPAAIVESSIDIIDSNTKESESRVRAIVESVQYGSEIDQDALVEAGWETIKRNIKNFFEKIKKFIKSIIAKIREYIDSYIKSGAQLASKYKDEITKRANAGAYKELEFNGYNYIKDIGSAFNGPNYNSFGSVEGLNKLIKLGNSNIKTIAEFKSFCDVSDFKADADNVKEAKKALSDLESNKLKKAVIEDISGVSSVGSDVGDWKKALMKFLQGNSDDKRTIKYGTSPFVANELISYFDDPSDWKDIQSDYVKLEQDCNRQERELEDIKVSDEKNTAGSDALSAYISTYLNRISDCWTAMTIMRDAKVSALKACNNQAKAMLGKLVRKSEKKKDNNDVEIEEMLDFDFD